MPEPPCWAVPCNLIAEEAIIGQPSDLSALRLPSSGEGFSRVASQSSGAMASRERLRLFASPRPRGEGAQYMPTETRSCPPGARSRRTGNISINVIRRVSSRKCATQAGRNAAAVLRRAYVVARLFQQTLPQASALHRRAGSLSEARMAESFKPVGASGLHRGAGGWPALHPAIESQGMGNAPHAAVDHCRLAREVRSGIAARCAGLDRCLQQ